MKKNFTTKDGKKIIFIDGFMKAHRSLFIDSIAKPDKGKVSSPMSYKGWLNDLFTYSMMIDFFEEVGITKKFKNSLDLGGAQGTLSYFLRSEKRSEQASCIEIRNMKDGLSSKIF